MSSDTTKVLLQTAWDRLIAYSNGAGRKLTDSIGTNPPRLYNRLTPDAIQYPYVAMRCSEGTPDVDYGNLRVAFTIEARCVHRSEDGTTEEMADLIEEALLTWRESSATLGVTFGQSSRRESQEPLSDVTNRDLAEVTVFVTCISWATRLTAIAT